MNRDRILDTLRSHQEELQTAGIVHLSLFGSVVRGEATSTSDIDLMADLDPSKRQTLVTIGSLQSRLTTMLGSGVELSLSTWMREPILSKAKREAVRAF